MNSFPVIRVDVEIYLSINRPALYANIIIYYILYIYIYIINCVTFEIFPKINIVCIYVYDMGDDYYFYIYNWLKLPSKTNESFQVFQSHWIHKYVLTIKMLSLYIYIYIYTPYFVGIYLSYSCRYCMNSTFIHKSRYCVSVWI